MAAVLTGWRTRRTVIDRNISVELEFCFRVCSSQFFSHISCVFRCRYLINGKQRIYRYDIIVDILWKGVCLCGSFCNGELYEIKLRIIQNDGRVSVPVMCQDDSYRWVLRRAAIVGKLCRRVAVWGINSAKIHNYHHQSVGVMPQSGALRTTHPDPDPERTDRPMPMYIIS